MGEEECLIVKGEKYLKLYIVLEHVSQEWKIIDITYDFQLISTIKTKNKRDSFIFFNKKVENFSLYHSIGKPTFHIGEETLGTYLFNYFFVFF